MKDAVAVAVEFIRKRGTVRTPAIAEELGIGEAAVDAMLAPEAKRGVLNKCDVLVGGRWIVEYRCSASGGAMTLHTREDQKKPPTFPQQRIHESPAPQRSDVEKPSNRAALASSTTGSASASAGDQPREKAPMTTFFEKVSKIFRERGPLTSRELTAAGVKDANASTLLGQLAKRSKLGILGGGARSKIYGLPDQTLADRKEPKAPETSPTPDRAPRSIHPKKKARRGKVAKKKQRKTRVAPAASKAALKAWETRRKRPFRPALAADGAILMLGAKRGDFEIPREQARGLVDLQRRLTPHEIADLVNFVTRLDRAEVAA